MATTKNLPTLTINYLTQAQFDTAVSQGTIDADQIYLTPDNTVVPTINLNGSAITSPSFYAPTEAGSNGQYLKSNGSGAPSWATFPTIVNTRGTAASGGTTLSVVNTGDMYTWNNKQDKLTNPVTGTGTSGYLVKWNGTTSVTNGPAIGSGTTKFLREDGTWQVPSYTTNTDEKVKSTPATAATTYYLIGSTSSTENTATTNKHAALRGYTTADSETGGSARIVLGNTTATTTAGGKEGLIRLYGTTATYYVDIKAGAPSANRTITFPNATGTVALTSQIPSVPTTAANAATDISIADHGTTSVGSASNWSAGTASSWAFEEISIPNVTAAGSGSYSHSGFSGGSGSFSATVTSHVLSFSHTHTAAVYGTDSHTHTAPTIGTAIKVQSKKSGSNSTVPSLTITSTTVVNGKSHNITDSGHTHTLS